jgi:hypothetical protein
MLESRFTFTRKNEFRSVDSASAEGGDRETTALRL